MEVKSKPLKGKTKAKVPIVLSQADITLQFYYEDIPFKAIIKEIREKGKVEVREYEILDRYGRRIEGDFVYNEKGEREEVVIKKRKEMEMEMERCEGKAVRKVKYLATVEDTLSWYLVFGIDLLTHRLIDTRYLVAKEVEVVG